VGTTRARDRPYEIDGRKASSSSTTTIDRNPNDQILAEIEEKLLADLISNQLRVQLLETLFSHREKAFTATK